MSWFNQEVTLTLSDIIFFWVPWSIGVLSLWFIGVNQIKKTLKKSGVIFCSFSEAVKEYPDLIKQYLSYYSAMRGLLNPHK